MKNLHKWCLLAILLLSCPLAVLAQSRTVTGTVRDASGAVIGASVTVKGDYSVGAITDPNGNFSLTIPASAQTLVISFVGYENQEIEIGNRTSFEVMLEESSVLLDEVVAIGYARVRRRDLTGAVSSVSGTDLAAVPAMNAAQALQGKAAGVNIVTASGAPGAGVNITIRGGTSITQSTKPLYIVDGFEMDDALTNINISDIESIEILKDASSTAIYGARGSNGIVLITTKSGIKGRTQISYNAFVSFDTLSKKLDMMSNPQDYVTYQYEMAELQGKTTQWSNVYDNSKGIDSSDFYSGVFGRIQDRYAGASGINWQEEVFGGSAVTQNHNLSISTGTDKTQVLLSYNHNNQDGLLAKHNLMQNSFRAKINTELYKGVRVDVNTMFTDSNRNGGGSYSGMKKVLLQPIHGGTLFTQDELLNTQTFPDYSGLDSTYDTENPIVQNNASSSNQRIRMYTVNAGLEIDFLKHFTWRTAGNYSWTNTGETTFADENSLAYLTNPNNVGINGSIKAKESYRWQVTNTLNYNQTFAEIHKVNVLLGQEVTYNESKENKISYNQFPFPNFGLDKIELANVSEKESKHSHSGLVSFFARANYTYDERYLLTATIRTDGSSKFADGNRWGVFPSVSGAWRVSEEAFWKNSAINNTVNSLKLRLGYGITGNNGIDNNLYTTTLSQSDYPINNNTGNAVYIPSTNLGNRDLKWETLNATNVGLDVALFNSRLNITAEWYNNEISDMLMKSVIPTSTGYATQYQNVGKMRNRGWEFTINTNLSTRDFRWTADLNLAFNTSKVTSLEYEQDSKTFSVGGNRTGTLNYYAVVGQPLGDMYGYKYEGIYTTEDFIQNADGSLTLKDNVVKPASGTPKPGDMKFAADNEEGDQFTRQPVKIGNGTPDMIGGFNNTFYYKGFDLSVFMKFSVGNDIYNATKHSMSPYAMFQNAPEEFGNNYYRLIDPSTGQQATTLARMKELNPDESSRVWNLGTTNSSYITYPSSYYVEDGSYLRIAQVTLGYSFPQKWVQKARINNARLYFTVNNLATITGYSGYDPEVSAANNDHVIVTPGYDSSTYPRSRSYVIGLNLTF